MESWRESDYLNMLLLAHNNALHEVILFEMQADIRGRDDIKDFAEKASSWGC